MLPIGKTCLLVAEKRTDSGFRLSDGRNRRETVLLPNKFVPPDLEPGGTIEVFLLLDSEDRPVATTRKPKAEVGDFALLRVKETTKIGAFLDWGLEKDLLLPFREQPRRVAPGEDCLVRVYADPKSGRIAASCRLGRFCKGDVTKLEVNQPVRLIVWEKIRLGCRVIVEENYLGILYFNELFQPVAPGERLTGFVHAIRPGENRVDVRLRKDGFRGVAAEKPALLAALRDAGGFLPLNAKSSPEEIQRHFPFSKRVFKQLVGMLYKERAIVITETGIRLADAPAKPR